MKLTTSEMRWVVKLERKSLADKLRDLRRQGRYLEARQLHKRETT